MNRKTILTLGAAATAAVVGALTLPVLAGGFGPNGMWGPQFGGPQMMMQMMHSGQTGAMPGPWMMMQRGPFGGAAPMSEHPIYKSFDTDADGTVSAAEAQAGITALHAKFDANADGSLSKDEFGALFAQAVQGFSERPFAMLDADGDGQISPEELTFPAQMMARMGAMPTIAAPAPAK